MNTKIKRFVLAGLLVAVLVLLTACDSGVISTDMSVDDSFKGTRVMSFDIKQSDLSSWDKLGLFSPKAADIAGILQDACPEQLSMETQKDGNDINCSFTLVFTNKEDYSEKVAALLGKNPRINFTPSSDDLFESGITLNENFSSADLFGWAETALAEAYPTIADKINFDGKVGTTTVYFEGVPFTTEARINVVPALTTLQNIVIDTTRFGSNDYERSISISITPENLERIGQQRLQDEFFAPLIYGIEDIAYASWDDKNSAWVITMKKGDLEQLERFTGTIFPESTVSITDVQSTAFAESSTLSEHIFFSGFKCNPNGTANIQLNYTAGDDTNFVGSSNKKSYSVMKDDASYIDVSVVSETRHTVNSVTVSSKLEPSGKANVTILLGFPAESSRSASEGAAKVLSEQYADTGLKVESRLVTENTTISNTDYATGENSESLYALILSASGKPEAVTECLSKAFGEGNGFSVRKGSLLSVYRENIVSHRIDLTELLEQAQYEGTITYNFSADMAKLDRVYWTDNAGGGNSDILGGKVRNSGFVESNISTAPVEVGFRCRQMDVPFLILALIALVGAACFVMLLIGKISNSLVRRNKKKKEAINLEAVRTVALATVPEDQRGELTELPPELTRRPTVVLVPRNDDGLDEDYDEPEGVTLFASTLKILIIAATVLFFFPFFDVKKTGELLDCSLSGWNLFFGKSIYDVPMEGIGLTLILLIIPVVILALLMARRTLPKLVIPVVSTVGSLISVFYLLNLPNVVEKKLDFVRTQMNASAYLTDPSAQMAYTYSIVIYVLLAIGCIILLFTDLAAITAERRHKIEEED
ncbi:MAG: hypothetical protein E7559_08085 [Ruminococcaceae bacterium]|nr:hypothetical protein [Oscillospiraceae bacterium]